jgi:hypothetical protein
LTLISSVSRYRFTFTEYKANILSTRAGGEASDVTDI